MKKRYILPALIVNEKYKNKISGMEHILKRMTNVKEIRYEKIGDDVEFDMNITPELEAEWLISDLIRTIQRKRKDIGLKIGDKITLNLPKNEIIMGAKNRIEKMTGTKIVFKKEKI